MSLMVIPAKPFFIMSLIKVTKRLWKNTLLMEKQINS